jgi:hypothetical protein
MLGGIMLAVSANAQLPPPEATEQWEPVPPVVSINAAGIPDDAIILFDGTDLSAWEPVKEGSTGWKIEDGAMVVVPGSGDLRTRQGFGDVQLHIEFRLPHQPANDGQKRGNSGVYLMQTYELQVLDSYNNTTYVNGQCASVYKQYPPLVNACLPPGAWQSYDIIFIAPRFAADGSLDTPARMTVLHNGVLVQHDVPLLGATVHRGLPAYQAHADRLPLMLQDHKDPVAFRNIWIRELKKP